MTDLETRSASPGRTSTLLADPGFLRPVAAMRALNPWVSLASRFDGPFWDVDVDPPHLAPVIRLNWSGIAEPLRSEIKVAILRHGSGGPLGAGQDVTTLVGAAYGAIPLGRWMSSERLRRLADLGEGGGDTFLHALAEKLREIAELEPGEEPEGWDARLGDLRRFLARGGAMTFGRARGVAAFLLAARANSDQLDALGIEPLGDPPFIEARTIVERQGRGVGARNKSLCVDGVTAIAVGEAFGHLKRQVRERLPDAVRDPMLSAFASMLDKPADDFLRFMRRFADAARTHGTEEAALATLKGFCFSKVEGRPWRQPFGEGRSPSYDFRRMLARFVGAASALALDATGMRPSEYVMLRSGRRRRVDVETAHSADRRTLEAFGGPAEGTASIVARPATLPGCVTETVGVSGLSILFHVHGRVFKGRKHPVKAYWLLGGRQDDGPDPIAVRALDMLERLSQVLRPFADEDGRDRLCLEIASAPDAPFACTGLSVGRLQDVVGQAFGHCVDLSGIPDREGIYDLRRYRDSGGRCVNLYQFRRTYVQLAFRTEPRLLVPLARQLQHQDTVVTRRAYVTNDPTLLRELERERSRETVAMFREAVEGKRTVGGAMGARIDEFVETVREQIMAVPERSRDAAVARAFRVEDYRVHFFEEATCFIGLRPRAALCNRQTDRADWKITEPDLSIRDASMCASCANGCFDRDRHGPVILRRYVGSRLSYLRQRKAGRGQLFRAWSINSDRDAALLKRLGLPYPTDEELARGI